MHTESELLSIHEYPYDRTRLERWTNPRHSLPILWVGLALFTASAAATGLDRIPLSLGLGAVLGSLLLAILGSSIPAMVYANSRSIEARWEQRREFADKVGRGLGVAISEYQVMELDDLAGVGHGVSPFFTASPNFKEQVPQRVFALDQEQRIVLSEPS